MSADTADAISFEVIKNTYIDVLKKYVVINGRARRREFWIFFFCNLVLSIIPVVGSIVALVTFIPNITVGVRRFHDTNRSGKWWFLGLAPSVGIIFIIVGAFSRRIGVIWVLSALVILASLGVLILLLVWAAQEGTHGDNQYGPDPKTHSTEYAVNPVSTPAAAPTVSAQTDEKPVFCGECGAKNKKGTKFCGECGKPL